MFSTSLQSLLVLSFAFVVCAATMASCEEQSSPSVDLPATEAPATQPAPAVESQESAATAEPESADWRRVSSNDESYIVEWRVVDREAVPVNDRFALEVRAFDDNEKLLAAESFDLLVDAAMPHHGHGMNRLPIIEQTDSGTWIAKGMLFHMPGRWELYFDVEENGVIERAQTEVMLD